MQPPGKIFCSTPEKLELYRGARKTVLVSDSDSRHSAQRQARALGDPTRHAIFRYIEQARRPVDVPELTEHFELNHNTIRQHLARLCDARLLVETTAPTRGPGRRRLEYRLAPDAGEWGSASPYRRLSLWLLEMRRTKKTPREVGRNVGRETAGSPSEDVSAVDRLEEVTVHDGFEPRRMERRRYVELVLERCPFADAAGADPATVCDLHRGIAEGVVTALGEDFRRVELIPRDPHRAGCRLRISR